jgi:hypothetical protein
VSIGSALVVAMLVGAQQVPQARPPIIDGRVDVSEWNGGLVQRLADGTTIRMQNDGCYLFIAITGARQGFPSICIADGDSSRVLHASAALGSVRYVRSGAEWTTTAKEFVYEMRDPDDTDKARQERRAYLQHNGWLATTFRMGGGLEYEIQIALECLDHENPRLALGYLAGAPDPWFVQSWPESLAASGDGCADVELLRGSLLPRLRFSPEHWHSLSLDMRQIG